MDDDIADSYLKIDDSCEFSWMHGFSDVNELKTCGEVYIIWRKLRRACKHHGRAEHVLQKQKWCAKVQLQFFFFFLLEFMFKIMFFSTINLTLQDQNSGKIEFYNWRGLKQRRELILKDRNEAGNAIPTTVLCEMYSLQKWECSCNFFEISAWKYTMQAQANIKVLEYITVAVSSWHILIKIAYQIQSGNTGKPSTSPSGLLLMDLVITSISICTLLG